MSGLDCLNRVVDICRNLPTGRLLDIPTGEGYLALRLYELKFEVFCADIDGGLFKAAKLPFKVQNLNKRLDYSDQYFDIIACIAGLQRIAQPSMAMKEFARILKDDGILLAAIPNYAVLRKRVRYLLTGSIDKMIDFPIFNQKTEIPEANFRMLITIPRFVREAQLAGFQIESIQGDRFSKSTLWYFPLILMIKIFSLIQPKKGENDIPYQHTSSLTALGCRYVIFICRKKKT